MNIKKSSDISIESPIVPIKLTTINKIYKIDRVKKYRVFSSF